MHQSCRVLLILVGIAVMSAQLLEKYTNKEIHELKYHSEKAVFSTK